MAGHSQFKNIMHRKGRQDAQRAKIFTKIIREFTTAARLGAADPGANPRLRAAVIAARDANMTRDTIDRAIKRGSGLDADANYDEVRYEGYGPGGVALIVEGLTNNHKTLAVAMAPALPLLWGWSGGPPDRWTRTIVGLGAHALEVLREPRGAAGRDPRERDEPRDAGDHLAGFFLERQREEPDREACHHERS